jgi:hypothetical protein
LAWPALWRALGDLAPVWLVLAVSLAGRALGEPLALVLGAQEPWLALWRFVRLCLVVALPALALPWLCSLLGWWLNRGSGRLLAVPALPEARTSRLVLWLLRPGQGLGLLLLAASKVLALLQLYTGAGLHVVDLPSAGQHISRLRLTVWGAGVAISLVLSALWTLDDLHLRLYDAKSGEIRRLGRYLGVVLPVLFGFYGIYQVFAENAHLPALRMTARMILVLYPAFVVLSVLHSHLLRAGRKSLLRRLGPLAAEVVVQPRGDGPPPAPPEAASHFPSAREACDEP